MNLRNLAARVRRLAAASAAADGDVWQGSNDYWHDLYNDLRARRGMPPVARRPGTPGPLINVTELEGWAGEALAGLRARRAER